MKDDSDSFPPEVFNWMSDDREFPRSVPLQNGVSSATGAEQGQEDYMSVDGPTVGLPVTQPAMTYPRATRMPADFLTKWIPSPKLERSLRYATNRCMYNQITGDQIGGSVSGESGEHA